RALAFAPVRIGELCQYPLGDLLQRASRLGLACRWLKSKRSAQPAHRRDCKPRWVDEGEQLEEVEAAQLGIAQPLPDQRGIQDDMRRFSGAGDRLASGRLASLPVS